MCRMPRITGKEAVKAFERAGFVLNRVKGSHHILKRNGVRLSIPVHSGITVGVGLLNSLISAAGLTVDEFLELLD